MVKNYQLDFCTQKDLTEYNKIALEKIFRDRLNTSLVYKLVEIKGINKGLTLGEQYNKIVEFERARRVEKGIFRKQADKPQYTRTNVKNRVKANLGDQWI